MSKTLKTILTAGMVSASVIMSVYACFYLKELEQYDDVQQVSGMLLLFALFINTSGYAQLFVTVGMLMANAELIDELVNRNEQINGSDYVNLLFAIITLTYLIYNKSRNGRLKRKSG